jgi:hypothetical protein
MYLKIPKLFFPCRRDVQEVGEEVGNVAEVTKEKDREEPDLAWALREARLHFTSESQNMDLMKDIGKVALLFKISSLISTEHHLRNNSVEILNSLGSKLLVLFSAWFLVMKLSLVIGGGGAQTCRLETMIMSNLVIL